MGHRGPVAQRITRLTTDQKIPGSNPGRIVQCFFIRFYHFVRIILRSGFTESERKYLSREILHGERCDFCEAIILTQGGLINSLFDNR